MMDILKDYFWSLRFVIVLIIFGLGFISVIVKDIYSYKQAKDIEEGLKMQFNKSQTELKKAQEKLSNIQKNQDSINKKLDLVLRENVIASGDWKTVDVSRGAPPVVTNTIFLLFKSKEGVVAGYVKGAGYDEVYPFDSSLNNQFEIAVKVKETKIQYMVTAPKDKTLPLEIFVSGFRFNR